MGFEPSTFGSPVQRSNTEPTRHPTVIPILHHKILNLCVQSNIRLFLNAHSQDAEEEGDASGTGTVPDDQTCTRLNLLDSSFTASPSLRAACPRWATACPRPYLGGDSLS